MYIGRMLRTRPELHLRTPFILQPTQYILRVSKLENSMGMQLFTRTGGKFLLSFAGECYVEEAKDVGAGTPLMKKNLIKFQ